jgi:hypothetical protein
VHASEFGLSARYVPSSNRELEIDRRVLPSVSKIGESEKAIPLGVVGDIGRLDRKCPLSAQVRQGDITGIQKQPISDYTYCHFFLLRH